MALVGLRVLELAGLAPAPFCGMVLADFGAEVVRVDRVGASSQDTLARGKKSICLDMKCEEGRQVLRQLIKVSDVLIEPFRPGVMEKLGFSEKTIRSLNKRIIYVRLTGFGQTGPLAKKAGHDINYVAVSGALSSIRATPGGRPIPPVNLLGDFAGGGMLAVVGILIALQERLKSGEGQVVDANMVDGCAYLSTFLFKTPSILGDVPGGGALDGGAPFYRCYETKDRKWVSVGAIEPHFFAQLIKGMGIEGEEIEQFNKEKWGEYCEKFQKVFSSRTLGEWEKAFEGLDACFAPVVELNDVMGHPHNQQRNTLIQNLEGEYEPPAAPRLSRTPGRATSAPLPIVGGDTVVVMKNIVGMVDSKIQELLEKRVLESAQITASL